MAAQQEADVEQQLSRTTKHPTRQHTESTDLQDCRKDNRVTALVWLDAQRLQVVDLRKARLMVPEKLWASSTPPQEYEPEIKNVESLTLTELANAYGTDKADIGYAHKYTRIYEKLISRNTTRSLCEIGVACGASLKMWSRYLPDARIVGIDIRPGCASLCKDYPNIDIIIGNVTELDFTGQFDVVIDDASHISEDVVAFADHCISWLRPGGIHIIEDMARTWADGWAADYNSQFATNKSNDRSKVLHFMDKIMRAIDTCDDLVSFEYYRQLLIIRKSQ